MGKLNMNYLILVISALTAGMLSFGLICLAKEADDAEQPTNIKNARIYSAISAVVNMAVICTMYAVYHEERVEIIHLLTLLAVLWACAWTDKKGFIIPNRILLVGLVLFLLLFSVDCIRSPESIRYNAVSGAVAAGVVLIVSLLCRLFSPGAIGFGDIKKGRFSVFFS